MADLRSRIYKRGRYWVFHIADFDDDINADFDALRFSDCILWTETTLDSYPRVKRMSYDMWYFDKRIDAEKFQTLWLLKFSA